MVKFPSFALGESMGSAAGGRLCARPGQQEPQRSFFQSGNQATCVALGEFGTQMKASLHSGEVASAAVHRSKESARKQASKRNVQKPRSTSEHHTPEQPTPLGCRRLMPTTGRAPAPQRSPTKNPIALECAPARIDVLAWQCKLRLATDANAA